MIRVLLIAAAFLVVTIGLLILQPGAAPSQRAASDATPPARPRAEVQVSRSQTDLSSLAAPAASADAPNPADRIGAAVGLSTAPEQAPETDPLRDLTAAVLAGLGGSPAATAPRPDDPMRDMTAGVLASLTAATAGQDKPHSLETLIVQAMREGQSDAYLDALLNEAADSGALAVPAALRTAEGRVDTPTLLATLVARSTAAAPPAPARLAPGDDGIEVRVVQRADETVQYNFYTVQPGDSLGSIAHRFYGDARHFQTIFEANRQFLSSPDRIRAGQRLAIPALTAT